MSKREEWQKVLDAEVARWSGMAGGPVKALDYRLKDLKLCPVYDSVFACQGYSGNSFLL